MIKYIALFTLIGFSVDAMEISTQPTPASAVKETGECPICFTEFDSKSPARYFFTCTHGSHRSCIDKWLTDQSKTCPICRAIAKPELVKNLPPCNLKVEIPKLIERYCAQYPAVQSLLATKHVPKQSAYAEFIPVETKSGFILKPNLPPLCIEIQNQHIPLIAQRLIQEQSARQHLTQAHNQTPLHFIRAFQIPELTQLAIQLLLKAGADINATDSFGLTALHWAILRHTTGNDQTDLINVLIGFKDIDLNMSSSMGSPLDIALQHLPACGNIVKLLMFNGAQPTSYTLTEYLTQDTEHTSKEEIEKIFPSEIVRSSLLGDHKAIEEFLLRTQPHDELSQAFVYAIVFGHTEIVRIFLKLTRPGVKPIKELINRLLTQTKASEADRTAWTEIVQLIIEYEEYQALPWYKKFWQAMPTQTARTVLSRTWQTLQAMPVDNLC